MKILRMESVFTNESFKSDGVHLNELANGEVAHNIMRSIQFTSMKSFSRVFHPKHKLDTEFPSINKKRKLLEVTNPRLSPEKRVKPSESGQDSENRTEQGSREHDFEKDYGQNDISGRIECTVPPVIVSGVSGESEQKNDARLELGRGVHLAQVGKDERCKGFSGAGVCNLVREASMNALKESLKSGCNKSPVMVEKEHFQETDMSAENLGATGLELRLLPDKVIRTVDNSTVKEIKGKSGIKASVREDGDMATVKLDGLTGARIVRVKEVLTSAHTKDTTTAHGEEIDDVHGEITAIVPSELSSESEVATCDKSVQAKFVDESKLCTAIKHLKQELEDANNLIDGLIQTDSEAEVMNKLPQSLRSKKISVSVLYTTLVSLEAELRDKKIENENLKAELKREKNEHEKVLRGKDLLKRQIRSQTEMAHMCREVLDRSNRISHLEEVIQSEKIVNAQAKKKLFKLLSDDTPKECNGEQLQGCEVQHEDVEPENREQIVEEDEKGRTEH